MSCVAAVDWKTGEMLLQIIYFWITRFGGFKNNSRDESLMEDKPPADMAIW